MPAIIVLVTAVLTGGVALLFLWISASEWSIWLWLRQSGLTVQGRITDYGSQLRSRGTRYYVIYTFKPQNASGFGGSFKYEQQVKHEYLNNISHGMPVAIAYLPRRPDISRLTGEHADYSVRNVSTVISVMLMIVFPPLAVFWPIFFVAATVVPHRWLQR